MTTVTDEMTGAAIEAVWDAVKADNPPDGWTDWIDDRVMHAALEAALAVMLAPDDDVDDPSYTIPLLCEPAFVTRGVPVGETPTDAEFREAVESLIDASMGLGNVMAFPDDPEFEADDADAQSALDTAPPRGHAHGRIPGGAMMEARDVIAHLLHERHPFGYPATLSPFDDSDAILAALHDAGFVVVERTAARGYEPSDDEIEAAAQVLFRIPMLSLAELSAVVRADVRAVLMAAHRVRQP
jgi:hypothetical protein